MTTTVAAPILNTSGTGGNGPNAANVTSAICLVHSCEAVAAFAGSAANRTFYNTKIGVGGTLSEYEMKLVVNQRTSSSTFTLCKNDVSGSSTVNFASGVVGTAIDAVHTDAPVAGDTVRNSYSFGAGTSGINGGCSVEFQPASGCAYLMGSAGTGTTVSGTSVTLFQAIGGALSGFGASTEANAQALSLVSGTATYFGVSNIGNPRTTSTVYTLRKNGGNGNLTVTVASGVTGPVVDTTHADSIAVNDLVCFAIALGAGSGSMTFAVAWLTFVPVTNGQIWTPSNHPGGTVQSVSGFSPAIGNFQVLAAAETSQQLVVGENSVWSQLTIALTANASTASVTYALRKNAANATQSAVFGSGVTGRITDNIHTDPFNGTDAIALGITGVNGSMTWKEATHLITAPVNYQNSSSVIQAEAVSLQNTVGKLANALNAESVSMSRSVGKNVNVLSTEGVSTSKAATKGISAVNPESTSAQKSAGKIITAIDPQSVSSQSMKGKGVLVSNPESVSLQNIVAKIISILQGNVASSSEQQQSGGVTVNVTSSEAVSLTKSVATTKNVTNPESVSLAKSVGKVFAVTQGSLVTVANSLGRGVSVLTSQLVTLVRAITKAIGVTQTESVTTQQQNVGLRVISLTESELVSIQKAIAKAIAAGSPETVTVSTTSALSKAINIAINEVVTVIKAVAKTIGVTQTEQASQTHQGVSLVTVNVTEGESVSTQRAVGKNVSVLSPQRVSVGSVIAHLISVVSTQSVSLIKAISKLIGAAQSENVTVTSSSVRSVNVAINQPESVTIQKQVGKFIGAVQNQFATVTHMAAQTVDVFVTQSQRVTVTMARFFFKTIDILIGEIVTIFKLKPNVCVNVIIQPDIIAASFTADTITASLDTHVITATVIHC